MPVKNWKSEYYHWILHVQIIADTKFQLKRTILISWTQFVQKEYSRSKTKKVNITIELCTFQLLWIPNFSIKRQFRFFRPNLPYFWSKTEKVNITIEFDIFELVYVQSFSLIWQFWIFRQNLPKYFWLKTENVSIPIDFCIFELVLIRNRFIELLPTVQLSS